MTDEEQELIEPFLPLPGLISHTRTTDLREVVNAFFYMAATSSQCRMMPKEFSSYSTVQGYFYSWRDEGQGAPSTITL